MGRRGWTAVLVVTVWLVTLGWHAKRLYLRPMEAVLAEAARTLPPGVAYYAVFFGERKVGWAQTEIDTLPSASGFTIRDQLILSEPLLAGTEPLRFRVDARLGPALALDGFELQASGIPGIRNASGDVHGDSLLEFRVEGDAGSESRRIELNGPVVLSAAWPLRFAAQGDLEVGRSLELPVFDPLTGSSRPIRYTILQQRMRTFPDSAVLEDGRWVVARRDTVDAWWVEQNIGGVRLRAWVDEDGRLVEAEVSGGLRVERTAFEFAYPGVGGLASETRAAGENQ